MMHQGFPLGIIKVSYTPIVNGLSGLDHAESRRVTHLCDQISGVKGRRVWRVLLSRAQITI